jgi:hypothetical protein
MIYRSTKRPWRLERQSVDDQCEEIGWTFPEANSPSLPRDRDPGIAGGNTAREYNFEVARLTVPA